MKNLIQRIATPFPLALASVHAVLSSFIFYDVVNARPGSDLLPIIVFFIDWPISYLILWTSLLFTGMGDSAVNWISAILFVVIGTLWWLAIGYLIKRLVLLVFGRLRSQPNTAR